MKKKNWKKRDLDLGEPKGNGDKFVELVRVTEGYRRLMTFKDISDQLNDLELKHKMTSADFLSAFERGDLPEEEEFFRWRVLYVGYQHLLKNWEGEK